MKVPTPTPNLLFFTIIVFDGSGNVVNRCPTAAICTLNEFIIISVVVVVVIVEVENALSFGPTSFLRRILRLVLVREVLEEEEEEEEEEHNDDTVAAAAAPAATREEHITASCQLSEANM